MVMASSRYVSSPATLVVLVSALLLHSLAYVASTELKFVLEKKVEYGQGFLLTGSDPALGSWDPENSPIMNVTGDSTWSVVVDLPSGEYVEYKPVLINYDTKEVLQWYPGENQHITVDVITIEWSDSANSGIFKVIRM